MKNLNENYTKGEWQSFGTQIIVDKDENTRVSIADTKKVNSEIEPLNISKKEAEANAERIVYAVNNIERLEKANKELLEALTDIKLNLDNEYQYRDELVPQNIVNCYETIQNFISLTTED